MISFAFAIYKVKKFQATTFVVGLVARTFQARIVLDRSFCCQMNHSCLRRPRLRP